MLILLSKCKHWFNEWFIILNDVNVCDKHTDINDIHNLPIVFEWSYLEWAGYCMREMYMWQSGSFACRSNSDVIGPKLFNSYKCRQNNCYFLAKSKKYINKSTESRQCLTKIWWLLLHRMWNKHLTNGLSGIGVNLFIYEWHLKCLLYKINYTIEIGIYNTFRSNFLSLFLHISTSWDLKPIY